MSLAPMSSTSDVRVLHSNAVSYLDSAAIRVVVGQDPDMKEFFVHEDLVCSRSQFFKNAMTESWKEAEDCKITLAHEEPVSFSLYIQLLYTNVLPVIPTTNLSVEGEYIALSKLYVLAEMLMDDSTKDIVLAAISARSQEPFLDKHSHYPHASCIYIIYGGTPEGSPARRLLVDFYTTFGDDNLKLAEHPNLPKDFFFDLSVSLLSNRPSPAAHKGLQAELSSSKKSLSDAEKQIASNNKTIRTLEAEKTRKRKLEEDLEDSESYSGRKSFFRRPP